MVLILTAARERFTARPSYPRSKDAAPGGLEDPPVWGGAVPLDVGAKQLHQFGRDRDSPCLVVSTVLQPAFLPVLTWSFTAPGHFSCLFCPHVAPCLLGRTDPAIRGLSKRPIRRRRRLWVPKTYATRRYSWITPPARSRRRTRKWSRSMTPFGSGRSGAARFRVPCPITARTYTFSFRLQVSQAIQEPPSEFLRLHRECNEAPHGALSPALVLPSQPQHRRPHLAMSRRAPERPRRDSRAVTPAKIASRENDRPADCWRRRHRARRRGRGMNRLQGTCCRPAPALAGTRRAP